MSQKVHVPISERWLKLLECNGTFLCQPGQLKSVERKQMVRAYRKGEQFLKAVISGDATKVRNMLQSEPTLAYYQEPNKHTSEVASANDERDTALIWAIRMGHHDVVSAFWEADPTLRAAALPNKYGKTPLHEAVTWNDVATIRLLLRANPEAAAIRNSDGKTAEELANSLGNHPISLVTAAVFKETPSARQTAGRGQSRADVQQAAEGIASDRRSTSQERPLATDKTQKPQAAANDRAVSNEHTAKADSTPRQPGLGERLLKGIRWLATAFIQIVRNVLGSIKGNVCTDIKRADAKTAIADVERKVNDLPSEQKTIVTAKVAEALRSGQPGNAKATAADHNSIVAPNTSSVGRGNKVHM